MSQILLRKLTASHKDFLLRTNGQAPSRRLGGHLVVPVSTSSEIPRATTIAPELEATGLKPAIAQQISDAYLKSADHFRQICQTSLHDAWTKASVEGHLPQEEVQVMTQAWVDAYAQQTRCWAENALSRARDAVAKVQTVASYMNEKKSVFNYEYTPLLEQYFQYNAYPSAPDRAVLARKSMMTPRQIEVWFQNHRTRAKKEGKVLRKLADEPLPSELSLRSLEEKMPYFTRPVDERNPPEKSGPVGNDLAGIEKPQPTATPLPVSSLSSSTVMSNPLNPLRSPQAFPMVYVHRDVDRFLTKPRTYKFPPPTWDRKPATFSHLSRSQIDMNGFILEFSQKLHLRAPDSRDPCSQVSQPWCADRYIPWCPAPHPALIRSTKVSLTCPPVKCLPTISATLSCPRAFRSPSPSALSTALVPTQPRSAPLSRKKVAGLPRRTPKHKSTAHAYESPASSETSEESIPPSSSSRISSFSSNVSSRRPSSSSSNSSSSSPTTPIMSSSSLPGDSDLSVSVSGVDFDYTDDLVNNLSEITSPAEKSFALSTAQRKQPFAFRFDLPALSRNHLH